MIAQSFKMSWKSIRSNKMRSFLTMLGIIIGVFSLVVLVSLVSGASGTITDAVSSIGTNLISVTVTDDHNRPIHMSDLEEYAQEEVISAVAPASQTTMTATSSLAEETVTVTGTTAAYQEIQSLTLASGRFLMQPDEENHSLVAVINHDTAIDVLGREDVVGESIRLNGQNFRIIGVLEEEESSMASLMGSSYTVYIPYETLIRTASGIGTGITAFYVSATDENLDAAEERITQLLDQRFSYDEDAYTVFNQSTIADVMGGITGVLFGLYPARKAARKKPIDALRSN